MRHALKVELDAALNHGTCPNYADCFRWPATQADSHATRTYGGSEPFARAGRPAGHPITTDVGSLGLETPAAAALAFTRQNYGAYVVDDAAWVVYALCVALGPDGDFTQQFLVDWGFTMTHDLDGPAEMWSFFARPAGAHAGLNLSSKAARFG